MKKINANTKGSFMLVLTSMIWGSSFVAQDAGLTYIGPLFMNFFRMLLGALALLPVVLFQRSRKTTAETSEKNKPLFSRQELMGGIFCGLLLFISTALQQLGMSFYGTDDAAAGKSGFITALYIIIVPILGLFFKKRPQLSVWISVILSFTGLYLLCFKGGHLNLLADGIIAGCALTFSVHILVVDYFSPKADSIKLSMLQFLVAGICSVCCFAFPNERALITGQNLLNALPSILYLGLFSCAVAYTLQVAAQKFTTNATVASILMSLESVFAVLTGALFGETLAPQQVVGCLLMFIAVILAQIDFKTLLCKKAAA